MTVTILKFSTPARWFAGLLAAMIAIAVAAAIAAAPAAAQNATDVVGTSDAGKFWAAVRQGAAGTTASATPQAGQLIHSEGEVWRAWRNGPISIYGAQVVIGVILLLAVFYLLRGRIAIDQGWSGKVIKRFNSIERIAHWTLAITFIILALTGLNVMFGRYIILPWMGAEAFATMTAAGKWLHNWLAWPFMASLVVVFLLWIRDNIPSLIDIKWLAKGGGLIGRSHPPAKKFNAGQKIVFWSVVLLGASISASGLSLLFPYQLPLFAKTFAVLHAIGFDVPTKLSAIQEMQFAQAWHAIVSLVLVAIMVAHIYIGTIGMQGAFQAMSSGKVDLNWAREHHSLWVKELEDKGELEVEDDPSAQPGHVHPAE